MKKLIAIATLCAAVLTAQGAAFVAIPSYIDGSSTTNSVQGTNLIVSAILAGATNTYNMPGLSSTNLWTALPMPQSANIQPFQNLGIGFQYSCSAANNSNVTFRIAASADNTHWVSNYFVFTSTANGTTLVAGVTNCPANAFPFFALQGIENPQLSAVVSNLVVIPVIKPGI